MSNISNNEECVALTDMTLVYIVTTPKRNTNKQRSIKEGKESKHGL